MTGAGAGAGTRIGPVAAGEPADPFAAGIAATEALWDRLARPVDHPAAFQAMLGAPRAALRQLTHLLVAGGPEAGALLDEVPAMMRVLRNTTGKRPERRRGELSGPVIWSETLSARAGSFGADDLFVCAAPFRDFDVPENRVFRYTLEAIVAAGDEVHRMAGTVRDGALGRQAARNRARARRVLGQRAFAGVRGGRPPARDIARARGSRDVGTYRPALHVLGRIDDPVRFADLLPFIDRRTRAQHALVLGVADELTRRGVTVPPFTLDNDSVRAGILAYRHPNAAQAAGGGLHGVLVGPMLVDVPLRVRDRDPLVARTSLERRAAGRPCAVVLTPADIPIAVAEALALSR